MGREVECLPEEAIAVNDIFHYDSVQHNYDAVTFSKLK
jgi:hypothetical protein